jgi:hypothetical protein
LYVWNTNTSKLESYLTANLSQYAISMTEQGTASAWYYAAAPANLQQGSYIVTVFQRAGGSPAEGDQRIATGTLEWNGGYVIPLQDLATSGQIGNYMPMRMFRGQMLRNFGIKLVNSDGITPFVSGTVSGQIARDGGSFGPLQSGLITETGLGWYNLLALTSGDLQADTVKLTFTAMNPAGGAAAQRDYFLVLNRVSGTTVT